MRTPPVRYHRNGVISGDRGGEDGWSISDAWTDAGGDWNVFPEINRTGEDVQAEFNEPLENKAKSLHQRVIRGHPDARFIATINPVKSEGRGIYEGKVMSGEFVNRFTNKVHLCYLTPDEEFEVLKDYGPLVDDRIIDRLLAVATDIRRDYGEEHGVAPFPVTTRPDPDGSPPGDVPGRCPAAPLPVLEEGLLAR
jgi:midasin (ATPase involved in ribosome maturation)